MALKETLLDGKLDGTVKRLKKLRQLLISEETEETEASAEKAKKLLEMEHGKGGIQVQALDYGKKRRKRR